MNTAEYLKAGYAIGLNVEQTRIDKAEAEVKEAYILPITAGDFSKAPAKVREATMALAFFLLSKQDVYVTRVGGRQKELDESTAVNADANLYKQAQLCHIHLSQLKDAYQNPHAKITDICGVYFKSLYFYT